jgi:hypothetical protein
MSLVTSISFINSFITHIYIMDITYDLIKTIILYYFVDTTIIKNIIKDITIIIKEFININNLII